MYGTVYGMRKTTIYLPDDLKLALERLAAQRGSSEAEVVREALAMMVEKTARPRPRLPLMSTGLGCSSVAERSEELLAGFGES